MSLWKLYVLEGFGGQYDAFDGHIIRAKTAQDARRMANETHGDEGPIWEDPEKTGCKLLTADGEAEIILSSFNAC